MRFVIFNQRIVHYPPSAEIRLSRWNCSRWLIIIIVNAVNGNRPLRWKGIFYGKKVR